MIQSGVVSCFGDNTNGELGYGGRYNITYRYTPKPVIGLPAGMPTKAQGVNKKREVRIVTLKRPTGSAACNVTTPASVKVKIGGKSFTLKVLAAKSIKPGESLAIRARLTTAASTGFPAARPPCR